MFQLPRSHGKQSVLKENAISYAQHSTIHGVPYIFDRNTPVLDRIFWALAVLGLLTTALIWASSAYQEWNENPVITTLKDTEKEVAGLEFPAVTICSEGLNMDTVYKALEMDINTWKQTQDPRQKRQADIKEAISD